MYGVSKIKKNIDKKTEESGTMRKNVEQSDTMRNNTEQSENQHFKTANICVQFITVDFELVIDGSEFRVVVN